MVQVVETVSIHIKIYKINLSLITYQSDSMHVVH